MFDLNSVRSALGSYSSNLKRLRNEIEVLERKIEDVMFAPVSKTDARAALHAFVDAQQADFKSALVESVKDFSSNSRLSSDPAILAERMRLQPLPNMGLLSIQHRHGNVDAASLQRSLCGLFGDAMKQSLSEALDAVPWPQGAMLESERKKRLAELQAEMVKLKAEEKRLVEAAEDLNLNVEGIE
jgi:hypothetical protein